MYKRKARVVFFDADSAHAALAADLANSLGGDWLVAQAAGLTHASVDADLKHWADLIVYFDACALKALQPLPPTTRTKHWPLVTTPDGPSHALEAELKSRVQGMIGGMRMLSRSSSGEDD